MVHKGSRVVVSGRIEVEIWTGRDGIERESRKFIADAVGPDLRFTTVSFNRVQRCEPSPKAGPAPEGLRA